MIAGSESNGAATSEQRGTHYLISAVEHQIYGWQPSTLLASMHGGRRQRPTAEHRRRTPTLDPGAQTRRLKVLLSAQILANAYECLPKRNLAYRRLPTTQRNAEVEPGRRRAIDGHPHQVLPNGEPGKYPRDLAELHSQLKGSNRGHEWDPTAAALPSSLVGEVSLDLGLWRREGSTRQGLRGGAGPPL